MTQQRNAYTTTRNAWGMGVTHTCDACAQTFRGEHSAAWHECPGKAAGWPYSDAAAGTCEECGHDDDATPA